MGTSVCLAEEHRLQGLVLGEAFNCKTPAKKWHLQQKENTLNFSLTMQLQLCGHRNLLKDTVVIAECSLYILFNIDPFLLGNCDVHKSVLCFMHTNMSVAQNQTHFHSPTWHYQKGVREEREALGQTPATKNPFPTARAREYSLAVME